MLSGARPVRAFEIRTTGQVGSLGARPGGAPDLLQAIGRSRRLPSVGMMHPPACIPDPLIDAYASEDVPFLHLPVQSAQTPSLSGCSAVTVRPMSPESSMFRERYPDMMISSASSPGFRGDGQEFRQTLNLLRRAAFVKVNITRYSWRPARPPLP